MDRTEIERIQQVIEELSKQMCHLDILMSVAVLVKGVLKKAAICNLLIQIAEHKSLIQQLEIDVSDALRVDAKRITDSLNPDRETSL